jgi:heme-degrading monooxygenase HmoA
MGDEEERRVLDELIPLCERSGGFHALYTVRLSERELANIFFWDTRTHAEQGFAAATPRIRALLDGILADPPERVSGDLLAAYHADQGSSRYGLIARPRFTRPVGDAEARRIIDGVIPLYKQSGGFHALYTVRVSEREVLNLSFWDSQADAERGFAAAAPYVREQFRGLLVGPPERAAGALLFDYQVNQPTTAG